MSIYSDIPKPDAKSIMYCFALAIRSKFVQMNVPFSNLCARLLRLRLGKSESHILPV